MIQNDAHILKWQIYLSSERISCLIIVDIKTSVVFEILQWHSYSSTNSVLYHCSQL